MDGVRVMRPGLLTTVQDRGRSGSAHLGVGCCGALDRPALHVANLLVGNPPDQAGLEFTVQGPVLRFTAPRWIAVTGALFDIRLNGAPLPGWRSVLVQANDILELGAARLGMRGYLAVRGGFAVASALASRSTDLTVGFGGWHGRALQCGDVLSIGSLAGRWGALAVRAPTWRATSRILVGPEFGGLTADAQWLLGAATWRVGAQSNRMGYRLAGPPLRLRQAMELPSHGVHPGVVQLPMDGQPIVLLADAQTTGGYPRIASVIQADLWLLAQAPLGARLRFVVVQRTAAVAALALQNRWLERIARGIRACTASI